eukprot:CAMPEP_0194422454 /NCGR_PEP_ID=MMETSP0176-20130528/21748_1 /TAXON_ID=216777 /ORGANISM="Proboscia alata, Strain PI-D3" /LENGTH=57 /DNA_ID=CAMNT_0039231179 /DNA_START=164 /DNA_END=337 /DNA_ORIENTATION=+
MALIMGTGTGRRIRGQNQTTIVDHGSLLVAHASHDTNNDGAKSKMRNKIHTQGTRIG